MSPAESAKFREATAFDAPFVFSSWLKSARGVPLCEDIPKGFFFKGLKREVSQILSRAQCFVLCDQDDETQIYSYIVCERLGEALVVHYAYTKQVFRRMGFAKRLLFEMEPELLAKGAIATSHSARITAGEKKEKIIRDRLSDAKAKYRIIYNPYLKGTV